MIIEPKTRGYIRTTASPMGCEANVRPMIRVMHKPAGFMADGMNDLYVVLQEAAFGRLYKIC